MSNRVDIIRTTSAIQPSDNTSNVINDIDYAGCFNVLYHYDATPDLNIDSSSQVVCNFSKLDEFPSRLDLKEQIREDFSFPNLQITHYNFICEDDLNLSVQEEKNCILSLYNLDNNNTEIVSDSTSFLDGVRAIAFLLEGLTDHEREIFIDKMTSFKKLFSPKSRSAGVYEYRINIKSCDQRQSISR